MVSATKRFMDMLDNNQLEGVIAHELSHIMHKDTIVNGFARRSAKVLSMSAFTFGAIAALGASLLGASTSGKKPSGGAYRMLFIILFIIFIPMLMYAVLCLMLPRAGVILRLGMSHSREYKVNPREGSSGSCRLWQRH